jgi:hypothetical protein
MGDGKVADRIIRGSLLREGMQVAETIKALISAWSQQSTSTLSIPKTSESGVVYPHDQILHSSSTTFGCLGIPASRLTKSRVSNIHAAQNVNETSVGNGKDIVNIRVSIVYESAIKTLIHKTRHCRPRQASAVVSSRQRCRSNRLPSFWGNERRARNMMVT